MHGITTASGTWIVMEEMKKSRILAAHEQLKGMGNLAL